MTRLLFAALSLYLSGVGCLAASSGNALKQFENTVAKKWCPLLATVTMKAVRSDKTFLKVIDAVASAAQYSELSSDLLNAVRVTCVDASVFEADAFSKIVYGLAVVSQSKNEVNTVLDEVKTEQCSFMCQGTEVDDEYSVCGELWLELGEIMDTYAEGYACLKEANDGRSLTGIYSAGSAFAKVVQKKFGGTEARYSQVQFRKNCTYTYVSLNKLFKNTEFHGACPHGATGAVYEVLRKQGPMSPEDVATGSGWDSARQAIAAWVRGGIAPLAMAKLLSKFSDMLSWEIDIFPAVLGFALQDYGAHMAFEEERGKGKFGGDCAQASAAMADALTWHATGLACYELVGVETDEVDGHQSTEALFASIAGHECKYTAPEVDCPTAREVEIAS